MISTLGNAEIVIHHPSRVDTYAVTSEQLELLAQNSSSEWKGHIQTALSVLTTSIINIMALGYDLSSASFRMNVGIGFLSLTATVISVKFYLSEKRKQDEKLRKILSQPVQELRADIEEL